MSLSLTPSPLEPVELSLYEAQVPDAEKTVTVDGRHYRVLGDEGKVKHLRQTLGSSDVSAKQFDAALLKLGMQDFASAKAKTVGAQIIIRSLTEQERAAAAAMNTLLENEVQENQFRGAVVVVHDGRPLLMKGYGPATASGTLITEKTLFHLGSITKQFTAVALMKLVERGEIVSLDDKISKYLPPRYADNPIWKEITIRQLLTHSSGIPNIPPPDEGVPHKYSSDDVISLFQDMPLEFAPGSLHKYSNSGYDLLGKIIENVSGQRYEEFLEENIFAPLGMHSTVAGPSVDIQRCAMGFERRYEEGTPVIEEVPYHASHLSKAYSAGNMLSTIEDMCTWDTALHTDKVLREENRNKLFQPELNFLFFSEDPDWHIDQMTLPALFHEGNEPSYPKASYALGWEVHPNIPKIGTIYEHGGSIPGFNTYILRYPETKSCIVVLSNLVDHTRKGWDGAGDLALRLEDKLLDQGLLTKNKKI